MVDHCLHKQSDEHTHKCDDWTEAYLVWKQEIVRKPEVIYVSYMFILGSFSVCGSKQRSQVAK